MKNNRLCLAAFLAPFSLWLVLHAELAGATLALDAGFDTDGIALLDIAAGEDSARDAAVQGNGAVVVVGRSRQPDPAGTIDYVAVTRLDGTTGAVDNTFGTNGTVTFLPGLTATSGNGGDGRAIAVQPSDQKIIVAGSWKADLLAPRQVFIARLGTDGTLDPTFGTGGVALFTPAGVTTPFANAVAVRSDGSIIVVGTDNATSAGQGFMAGVDSTGQAIAGFSDRVLQNPLSTGAGFGLNALVILSGDRILAGGGGGDLTLAQFTSTGLPDNSFGTAGVASLNVSTFASADGSTPTYELITALAVLGDGRILLAGRARDEQNADIPNRIVGRISAGGVLDTSFGSGGYAPLPDDSSFESPEGIAVRPSGDIVLVGQGFNPVQLGANGIARSALPGILSPDLPLGDVEVLTGGDLVAAGQRTVAGNNSAFAVVRLTATDLADGPDTVPDPFTFTTQTGLETEFVATSNTVTIQGLDAPAPISISSGDQYSIGCLDFGSAPGTVTNGQTVCVRTTSATTGLTGKNAFLEIGGATGQFGVVTGDATPDQFTFVEATGVAPNTTVTSAAITLQGLAIQTKVSVSTANGGSFSVGCTEPYRTTETTAGPGAQICVRHTSSANAGGKVNTTLTVGNGTAVIGVFTSTALGDVTPDAFSFDPEPDVAKSTVIVSEAVTLTGFDSNASIAVSGAAGSEYSIGCTNAFTATSGTVAPGQTVCVRHTSSSAGGTPTSTTLTVGAGSGLTGVSGVFTSTTAGVPDSMPDAFSFPAQTGVPLATAITSGAITIGGFDTAATISITGGTYSVGCGASFTTGGPASRLEPNSTICVRQTSAFTAATPTTTVLTVGGVNGTFTSTTLAGDAVPAPFSFTDRTGVDLSDSVTSAPVTITGIDIASPVTVTGGAYSIGCTSNFTATQGSITNGRTICVRHESSFDSNANVDTQLTIGTQSDTFTSTTRTGDQLPEDFSFTSQSGLELNKSVTSSPITVAGVDSPVRIVMSGPRDFFGNPQFGFSRDCTGTVDGQDGDILENGDTLCIVVQGASTDSTSVVVTVTIGGNGVSNRKTATFTATTGETAPDAFFFEDQIAVPVFSTVNASPVTITGITAPSRVEISRNGQYQINCTGSFMSEPGLVSNGDTICVRHTSANALSTIVNTTLTVGGVSDVFTSTTTAESKPLPGGSGMDVWSLLLLAPLVGYRRRRPVRAPRR